MAKLKFEPNIEIASSPTPWASGDEHKDATANAGACSQEQSSRPQSGYNINRAQGVPPAGGGEPRDTKVLSGEPIS
ncbi:hypothetical protein A2572_04510 [Candidatus Collierbacteria bacterium RIFOXYD1_FULL_40_9]|uniref:Uncharacterized protein n=1 Tax=Candidatus Collierbacteria bacterium RIFOXYD1_FULL_40_9 TaxID=1817731 RepID=A0A1F5FPZ1_9BACT|nr:MAG: hypothetical protein A2572_04510 [Candidatus Collierbacteria bacterium RIFOXYD1_FULL_40_9]